MKPGRKESGPDRDRTDDLLNAIQALSQLSYGPLSLSAGRRVRAVPAGRLGNVVVSGALVNQGISAPRRAFTSLAWREVPFRPAAGLTKSRLGGSGVSNAGQYRINGVERRLGRKHRFSSVDMEACPGGSEFVCRCRLLALPGSGGLNLTRQ